MSTENWLVSIELLHSYFTILQHTVSVTLIVSVSVFLFATQKNHLEIMVSTCSGSFYPGSRLLNQVLLFPFFTVEVSRMGGICPKSSHKT